MTDVLPPALVLTAGLGTRLAPLTDVRAKPAVPVAGIPLVVRQLRWLARQGVPAAVLNLHHRPHTITRCVGHGSSLGLSVRYSWETTILGTAGGPRRALSLLGSRFFVINGDTLTDVDLPRMLRAHESSGAQVTLAVTPNPAPERYGGIVPRDGWVEQFVGPGPGRHLHFVGVQLAEASVFAPLPENEFEASIGGIYDTLLETRPRSIGAHEVEASFHDVGTPADYHSASMAMARDEGVRLGQAGRGSSVDRTAALTRTIVWDHVTIGPGCRLVDCIVTDGVEVPDNSGCERAIITASNRPPSPTSRKLGNVWLTPFEPRGTPIGR